MWKDFFFPYSLLKYCSGGDPRRSSNGKFSFVQSKEYKINEYFFTFGYSIPWHFCPNFVICFLYRTTIQIFFWSLFLLWRSKHMIRSPALVSALIMWITACFIIYHQLRCILTCKHGTDYFFSSPSLIWSGAPFYVLLLLLRIYKLQVSGARHWHVHFRLFILLRLPFLLLKTTERLGNKG